jgi:hypothetical protein
MIHGVIISDVKAGYIKFFVMIIKKLNLGLELVNLSLIYLLVIVI